MRYTLPLYVLGICACCTGVTGAFAQAPDPSDNPTMQHHDHMGVAPGDQERMYGRPQNSTSPTATKPQRHRKHPTVHQDQSGHDQ